MRSVKVRSITQHHGIVYSVDSIVINPRREGYGTWFVCVCVSVRSISATTSKSKPR